MEPNKIISDEIKGWDKQTPAPLNWKALIWGSCWQCIVRPDWLQQAWILPDEGHIQPGRMERFQFRWRSAQTSSQSSAERPPSPWSVWGLGASAPSGYLACGATPGHKGWKTQINNNIEPLSPFALTAVTDPGGEFLFPEQKQAIEQQFLPKHNRKKQRQAFFNWFPTNKHFLPQMNQFIDSVI